MFETYEAEGSGTAYAVNGDFAKRNMGGDTVGTQDEPTEYFPETNGWAESNLARLFGRTLLMRRCRSLSRQDAEVHSDANKTSEHVAQKCRSTAEDICRDLKAHQLSLYPRTETTFVGKSEV